MNILEHTEYDKSGVFQALNLERGDDSAAKQAPLPVKDNIMEFGDENEEAFTDFSKIIVKLRL
jgi:hypothetical protein